MLKKFLKKNNFDTIITNFENYDLIKKCGIGDNKIIKIDDARSAAFFTMGMNQKSNGNRLLVIQYDFLSSVLSPATEAWFQKTNLYFLVLKNKTQKIDALYNDYFNIVELNNDNLTIEKNSLNYLFTYDCDNFDERKPVLLSHYIDNSWYVSNKVFENENMFTTLKNKQCIISRYLGILEGSKEKKVLLCYEDELRLDLNILNSRYIDQKFKVIVIENNNMESLVDWIIENGIGIYKSIKDYKAFYNECSPSILWIEKEELNCILN